MNGHAVVIGGSMAGLLAARVLADHYPRVTVVDRDRFPQGPEPRKGLPQARHVHVLLYHGQECLEAMFPGLQQELEQNGAPHVDWLQDARWFSFGGWAPRVTSSYISHPCSRDLLEWIIRRRLAALSRVSFVEEQEVIDLIANPDHTRIEGLILRSRAHPEQTSRLAADLLVDASGRDSRTPRWLAELGYPPPAETLVNSFLGYATRIYRKPAVDLPWKSLLVRGTPPEEKRGGVINPIEGERWMVTLAGAGRDYPPTDEAGFLEFARSLPEPILFEAIRDAEALSGVVGYRKTENRWHHFEQMKSWPANWIVLGDAVCAFNPVYGQGMTAAAMGALLLDKRLRAAAPGGPGGGFAHRFQVELAKIIQGPWLMATGDDYRYRETEGGSRGAVTRILHSYMDDVIALANHDADVFRQFFEVFQLLSPVSSMFHPRIWWKLLTKPTSSR